MPNRSIVSIFNSDHKDYPRRGPFHPVQQFPEYPFGSDELPGDNWVYGAVRQRLVDLDLDRERFGTPDWNPFSVLLRPGQRVVIKPNLVVSEHELGLAGLIASVAHGSVIRPIVDYAYRAVGPSGRITIADSPIKEVDFERITRITGLQDIVAFYASRGIDIDLLDIRDVQAYRDANGVIVGYNALPGDPLGYTVVDLAHNSMLAGVPRAARRRFRSTAAIYENEAVRHHTATVNEYSMPNTILQADALISVAKLKVHRKAGVTASLKNMIGTTNEKRWLPHHRVGTPSQGGDMVPDGATPERRLREMLDDLAGRSRHGKLLRHRLYPLLRQTYRGLIKPWFDLGAQGDPAQDFREGDWHGNDTIWRTTLDVNMVIRYANKQGRIERTPQRGYLSIIDGIIGGEREGPLHPSPKRAGLIVAGLDPVAVDLVCTTLMGFDFTMVPTVSRAHETPYWLGTNRPGEIDLRANVSRLASFEGIRRAHCAFIPARGWEGHIELPQPALALAPEKVVQPVIVPATAPPGR